MEFTVNADSKFTVRLVDRSEVIDFKKLWPAIYEKTYFSVEISTRYILQASKVPLNISTFNHFCCNRSTPGVVEAMEFINGLQKSNFSLKFDPRKKPYMSNEKVYKNGKFAIGTKKMEDIRKCVKYVPDDECVSSFWREILTCLAWTCQKNRSSALTYEPILLFVLSDIFILFHKKIH